MLRARLAIAILVLVLFRGVAPGQQAENRPLAALQATIGSLLDDSRFASARWGLRILEPDGMALFERDADKLFIPASNLKLYVSAAALERFGPNYRFRTSVFATGPVGRNGTLRGDLVLYGRGDPNLSARFTHAEDNYDEFVPAERIPAIEQMADQLRERGLRRVSGDLISDDSYFPTSGLGDGWEWNDLQFYYGAPISALTLNDNVVTFTVAPGRAGAPPRIEVRPQTAYVRIVNQAITTTPVANVSRPRIGVNRPMNSAAVEFYGTLPTDSPPVEYHVSIPDPATFAGTLLKEALARRGIRVYGGVRRVDAVARLRIPFDPAKATELAGVESRPLADLLKVVNRSSQNLHTEILLRHLGTPGQELDDYGRPRPSEARGLQALGEFLAKAGIDAAGLTLRDGSGLSRYNLVTPRATSELLRFMQIHPHSGIYIESLPTAGQGTLKDRMRGTPAEGKVRAKTGSMSFVNAMSGYVTTAGGQTLIFSFMANNYTGPSRDVTGVFDQICALLAAFAGEW